MSIRILRSTRAVFILTMFDSAFGVLGELVATHSLKGPQLDIIGLIIPYGNENCTHLREEKCIFRKTNLVSDSLTHMHVKRDITQFF